MKSIMTFIGRGSTYTRRTDLSELITCKGVQESCEYPPGYHDEQERADEEWRAARGQ